jgi:RNA polymerase sigma factor (sigma-70 family)
VNVETSQKNIEIQALVTQLKSGDRLAFKKLYELYAKAMFNISFRIINKREEAEDILQESFLSAFNNINQFEGKVSFGAWLKRIVINKSISVLKENSKTMLLTEEHQVVEEPIPEDDFEYTIDMVNQSIRELADGYRIIVSLFLFDNYSHKMIAKELGISESTSKSQYSRGRKKLAELLRTKACSYER